MAAVAAPPLSELLAARRLASPRPFRAAFPVLVGRGLDATTEHLGVGYLVAALRTAGAECLVVEVDAEGGMAAGARRVAAWRPDAVGLSLGLVAAGQAREFGGLLRRALGRGPFVVAGGPLPTHRGAGLLGLRGWEFLDGVVRGEGELPMLRLADALLHDLPLTTVPSLAYRAPGGPAANPMCLPVHDLDAIPPPARDQFELHRGRLAHLLVSTSRGCTSRCAFCNAPHAGNHAGLGRVWRGASAERVVDEIEALHRSHGFTAFNFVDSTFEDPGGARQGKERVAAIATEILRRGLRVHFDCCMQTCNWTEADLPLLRLLRRAGLESVLVGIESGADEGLRRWGKRSRTADNERMLRLLTEAGIHFSLGFILLHPYATFPELRAGVSFLARHRGELIGRFLTRLEVYPGAEVLEMLRADGLLLDDYDETLDPFGYRCRDDRVQALIDALCVGAPARATPVDRRVLDTFEPYHLELYRYFRRLRQGAGQDQVARILDEGHAAIDRAWAALRMRNPTAVLRCVDAAEDRDSRLTDLADAVVGGLAAHLDRMRSLQLQVSMRLHRAGGDVKGIRATAARGESHATIDAG